MLTAELAPYGIKVVASGRSTVEELDAFMDRLDELSSQAKQNWRLFVDARERIVRNQDVYEKLVTRQTKVAAVAAAYICRDATSTMQTSRFLRSIGVPAHRMLVLNGALEPDAEAKVLTWLSSRLG
jgi:hypothetical protein